MTTTEIRTSAVPPEPPFATVTPQLVQPMFPATPAGNIAANLQHVLDALTAAELADTPMLLMALGTIRAETECFLPLSEEQSHFNTSPGGHPFDLYDSRKDLGNQGPPDGASFRGRGFVQLTGRTNYTRYGHELSIDLVGHPELACEPATAARILACFLKSNEAPIRHALAANDLAHARRLVNGGSNGLDRFTAAYQTGQRLFEMDTMPPAQPGSPTQSLAHVDASTAPTQPQSSPGPVPPSPSNV
jgi:peptidoglycan L-alanyl-D-glutamate endopeptidase CwlK